MTSVKEDPPGHQHGRTVKITVDGVDRKFQDGVYKVAELKVLLEIKSGYVLEEVINGEFKPLNDERSIHIKGDEVFISHVPTGGSS